MTYRIYKYFLDTSIINEEQYVSMPVEAHVISVAFQRENLVLWAEVITEAAVISQGFTIAFTGSLVPPRSKHIATVQHSTGYVFHIYMRTRCF